MRFLLSDVADATGGELAGPDVLVDGATQDSRDIAGGELFIAIRAERDGHDFIEAARASGAAASLAEDTPDDGHSAVRVPDTGDALVALGALARRRLDGVVVGVTGSVGKTSTKDQLAAVFSMGMRTHANLRSFNNEIGVPLTLINAPDAADAVIVEMGARHPGDIAELCRIAQPTIGLITTVGAAHTEIFGSVEAVATAKAELFHALPADGCAVVNADNDLIARRAQGLVARVISFGEAGEVRARNVSVDDDLRASFEMETPWGRVDVRLAARGRHNVMNTLAAAAAGLVADIPLELVAEGLGRAVASPWRMDLRRTRNGAIVINDAYNANPMSVAAALESLAGLEARRRIAVLGVMAELGPEGESEHRRMADVAERLGIEVIAVDAPAYGAPNFADIEAARTRLGPLGHGDAVLIKGSRVAGLERLAEMLLGQDPAA